MELIKLCKCTAQIVLHCGGLAKQLRSDHGTTSITAFGDLKLAPECICETTVENYIFTITTSTSFDNNLL